MTTRKSKVSKKIYVRTAILTAEAVTDKTEREWNAVNRSILLLMEYFTDHIYEIKLIP